MNNFSSLTTGPISRQLVTLSFQIFCATILQYLNGTVSTFWVGRFLGEAALTALTNAQSILFLMTGSAFGIAMAVTTRVGQCVGADNIAGAKRVVSTGVGFFSLLSLVLALLGLVFAEPLLVTIKTPVGALALAVPYLRSMLLALPSTYLLAFMMSLLLGIGDSKTPLRFVVLSVIISVALTPMFVLGSNAFGGVGLVGVALANVTAQAASLIALLNHMYSRRHPLRLTRQDAAIFRIDWSIVRDLLRLGIPMGAQVLVLSLGSVLMITLVNRFGVDTTAAYGALVQLWNYILIPAIAIAAAVSTMTAQNVGAENWNRVRVTAHLGIGYSFAVTGGIVAFTYLAESYTYRLLLPSGSPAREIAGHVNDVVTWSLVFMSIPLVLFGVMRAAGAVMVPLFVHILSLLIVRYPLAAALLHRWHADAIWWSCVISIFVDVLLAILYYRYGAWHRKVRSPEGGGISTVHLPTLGDS